MDTGWQVASILLTLGVALPTGAALARKGTVKKGECEKEHKGLDEKLLSGKERFDKVDQKLDAIVAAQGNIREDIAALMAANGIKRDKGG